MTRLICTGDLQLGAGASLGPDRLDQQEAVWRQIIDLTREHQADALLVAGDIFEGPLPTPEQYRAFLRPLSEVSCPVLAISGNGRHDAAMRDVNALAVLNHPLLTVHSRPGTWRVSGTDTTVATLPWTAVSRLVAAQNGGDRNQINRDAADILLRVASDLRAEIEGSAVLMLHYAISGASLPTGKLADELGEPVLPLADLEALGFDAIVAAHIHVPQILATDPAEPNMPIFFVGSPQPLNFGEGGYEHGCWLLEAAPIIGDVLSWQPTFIPLESRPFLTVDCDYDPNDADYLDEHRPHGILWPDMYPQGAYVKVRFSVFEEDARSVDQGELRDYLLGLGAYSVTFEQTVVRPARVRVEGLDESLSDLQALELWVDGNVEGDRDRKAEVLDVGSVYLEEAVRV